MPSAIPQRANLETRVTQAPRARRPEFHLGIDDSWGPGLVAFGSSRCLRSREMTFDPGER